MTLIIIKHQHQTTESETSTPGGDRECRLDIKRFQWCIQWGPTCHAPLVLTSCTLLLAETSKFMHQFTKVAHQITSCPHSSNSKYATA